MMRRISQSQYKQEQKKTDSKKLQREKETSTNYTNSMKLDSWAPSLTSTSAASLRVQRMWDMVQVMQHPKLWTFSLMIFLNLDLVWECFWTKQQC